jgi:hypothetical protein
LIAGALAPIEAIKRGVGLGEGYNYAKAREDQIMGDARKNTGLLGDAAEMLGGGVTGGGLASAGVTTARALAPEARVVARSLSSAADAAARNLVKGAERSAERQLRAYVGPNKPFIEGLKIKSAQGPN